MHTAVINTSTFGEDINTMFTKGFRLGFMKELDDGTLIAQLFSDRSTIILRENPVADPTYHCSGCSKDYNAYELADGTNCPICDYFLNITFVY